MKGSGLKRYEGLFIFDLAGREEGLKDAVDKVTAEIAAAGGRVENVQKMDKKSFARSAKRKHDSGYFVNIIFEARPVTVAQLRSKFKLASDVFRVMFSEASMASPPTTPATTS